MATVAVRQVGSYFSACFPGTARSQIKLGGVRGVSKNLGCWGNEAVSLIQVCRGRAGGGGEGGIRRCRPDWGVGCGRDRPWAQTGPAKRGRASGVFTLTCSSE